MPRGHKNKAGSDAPASPEKKLKADPKTDAAPSASAAAPSGSAADPDPVLKLLNLTPSAESVDYVQNKKQFQLHTLLTEQRYGACILFLLSLPCFTFTRLSSHTKTFNLSDELELNAKVQPLGSSLTGSA
jgi:hypothetical protein